MPTVSEVCTFLCQLAPSELSESWDNTGLLLGRSDRDVQSVLTCLTLTESVAEEAASKGVQMVVSHHPILFRGTKRLTDETPEGRMVLRLTESGIAVYSPHTSYDSAREGINQQLAEGLGLQNVRPIRPLPADPSKTPSVESDDGSNEVEQPAVGAGRIGTPAEAVSLRALLQRAADLVGSNYLEYCGDPDRPVTSVAVACGSAGEFLTDATAAGCDVFVTGETRFHTVLEAQASDTALILLSHYHSERPAVVRLAGMLAAGLPGVTATASEADTSPLSLFQPNAD